MCSPFAQRSVLPAPAATGRDCAGGGGGGVWGRVRGTSVLEWCEDVVVHWSGENSAGEDQGLSAEFCTEGKSQNVSELIHLMAFAFLPLMGDFHESRRWFRETASWNFEGKAGLRRIFSITLRAPSLGCLHCTKGGTGGQEYRAD